MSIVRSSSPLLHQDYLAIIVLIIRLDEDEDLATDRIQDKNPPIPEEETPKTARKLFWSPLLFFTLKRSQALTICGR